MISEDVVKNILKKKGLIAGIQKYVELIHLLKCDKVDVSSHQKFQKLYEKFYVLRYGQARYNKLYGKENAKGFNEKYFKELESVKNIKDLTNDDKNSIYNAVCDITHACETSYFSKILHNIDTSVPIYDSVVGEKHFGYKRIDNGIFERKKQRNLQMYQDYCESFIRYTKSSDGQKIIELFDKQFPEYKGDISGVKKVDFVLWQDREKVKDNKVIKPQQIEIPQEFKCQK